MKSGVQIVTRLSLRITSVLYKRLINKWLATSIKKNKNSVALFFEEDQHVVNLSVSQRVCIECLDLPVRCDGCKNVIVHHSIGEFVDWMLRKVNNHYIFIAHNSGKYDSQFVIREFQKRLIPTDAEMSVTCNGNKLLGILFRSVYIKDSACFIPLPLEQFPKAFGLKEMKKGFFCHLFTEYLNMAIKVKQEASGFPENCETEQQKQDYIADYESKEGRNKIKCAV
jgi:hypothetical protein